MSEIKVRNATHSEFCFSTIEEVASLVQSGGITADWEIFHQMAGKWLPVTLHPMFDAWARGSGEQFA